MIITRKIFRYKGKLYRVRVYKHRDYDSCSGCIFLMENDCREIEIPYICGNNNLVFEKYEQ